MRVAVARHVLGDDSDRLVSFPRELERRGQA